MRLLLALALALATGPALAQDGAPEIAVAPAAAGPAESVGIALTQCLIWGPRGAAAELTRVGWSVAQDEVTRLSRSCVTLAVLPDGAWCEVSSPHVRQKDARKLTEYLLLTLFEEPIGERRDDLGGKLLWSEDSAAAAITLPRPGSDESPCMNDGQPGAALHIYVQ